MYDELDRRILAAIGAERNPLHEREVSGEAGRLARLAGREEFRVIDGRLQALRKRGDIQWLSKAQAAGGCGGWKLVERREENTNG
jgi:hypothetical protein